MARPAFALVSIVRQTFSSLFREFRRQRVFPAYVIALMVLVLAALFAFLSFAPILAPFIYPLF